MNDKLFPVMVIGTGALLMWSAVKNQNPIGVIKRALGQVQSTPGNAAPTGPPPEGQIWPVPNLPPGSIVATQGYSAPNVGTGSTPIVANTRPV